MEDKKAIEILTRMMGKYKFSAEEKRAVSAAIGALGWLKLGKSRLKNIHRARKAEREKDLGGNDKFFKK
jgi:hypothetical protein